MTIKAQLPDGTTLEFPDDTPDDIVDSTVRSHIQGALPKTGRLKSAAIGATQGATFGFGDEMASAIAATIGRPNGQAIQGDTWGQRYDNALKIARAGQDTAKADHPYYYTGGELAGGLAQGVAAAPLLPEAAGTVLGRAAQGAKIGAGTGLLYGFGSAEGGAANRLEGAAIGGTLGGAVGAALPPVAAGSSAVFNVGKNLVRATSPGQRAVSLIAKAAGRDKVAAGEFGPAIAGGEARNVPLAPVDLGPNLTRLGRTVETIPGEGSGVATEFMSARQEGQGNRLIGQIRKAIASPEDYYKTADELDTTRRLKAKPLYDAAYSQPAVDQWTPRIAELLKRPSVRGAFARAQRIAAEEGRNPKELGLDFNAAGDPVFLAGADKNGQIPSVQTMDYIKRGLDDVVEAYRDKTTGKLNLDTEGRAVNNTRAEFVGILRDGNADYSKALDAWSGPSHMLDVMNRGRDFARGDIELAQKSFGAMSPTDQELTRLSVARELKQMIDQGADGADKVKRIFGSPDKRDKLRMLFPDGKSWLQFQTIMNAEGKLAANARVIGGGSITGRIAAEQDDVANGLMEKFVVGGSKGAGMELVRRAFNGSRGLDEATSLEIANRLFTTDKGAARLLGKELQSIAEKKAVRISAGQRKIIDSLYGVNSTAVPALIPGNEGR